MDAEAKNSHSRANDKFRKLCEISDFLNTGLTPSQVHLCQKLIKKGINPEALAYAVKTVREEIKKIQSE